MVKTAVLVDVVMRQEGKGREGKGRGGSKWNERKMGGKILPPISYISLFFLYLLPS